uniref:GIY-YIG endonuclease n=1 Tax=Fusarium begoniae TaxID=48487 RepID=A0A6M4B0X8_9HYPO|nr:GIY-YIG endonuclease [Fusarium begoniae]
MNSEYNSILYKYVLKHGWQNFNFGVIEYIDIDKGDFCVASKRKVLYNIEQRYLDQINPSLNINKFAGSMKGYKHKMETKNSYSKERTGKCYKKIKGIIVRPGASEESTFILKSLSKDSSLNLSFPLYNLEANKAKLDNRDVSYSNSNTNRRAYVFEVIVGNSVIYRFKSVTKASEFLNISRRTLTIYSQNNRLWKDKFAFKIIKSELAPPR